MPRFTAFLLSLALLVAGLHASADDAGQIAPYQPRAGRTKPVVAVIGLNSGTETTDFFVPYGILAESGAADVVSVGLDAGPIQFLPALRIQPAASASEFDQRYPDGADYLIVPAVRQPDAPALLAWVREQADKGATIVSICDGALVAANAGVFKGYRATGHWATQSRREHDYPDTHWQHNVRYVADGKRVSSAGVSAAIPTSLALVEAIAGHERALQLAQSLGADGWSPVHDSERFHLGIGAVLTGARNMLLAGTDDYALPIAPGVDDLALALSADAYSRTHRSRTLTVAGSQAPVASRHGLMLLPDRAGADAPATVLALPADTAPLHALDIALAGIEVRYGAGTAKLVALELEYPRHGAN